MPAQLILSPPTPSEFQIPTPPTGIIISCFRRRAMLLPLRLPLRHDAFAALLTCRCYFRRHDAAHDAIFHHAARFVAIFLSQMLYVADFIFHACVATAIR